MFLSKVIAEALLSQNITDFTFLKEFDEGQRSGEIKVTFDLPFNLRDKKLVIKEHNMVELKKAVQDLGLGEENVEKALKKIKPAAFKKNLEIYRYAT